MRALSPEFAAALAGGATTLCHCWRLAPRSGASIGFTDHDRDITFSGVTFAAAGGLEASAFEAKLGFAIGGGEVSGALASASLTESELASGHYDGASVETWRVNWSNPAARLLIDIGVVGEVRRSEHAFTAEVRSIAHEFDQPRGRLYQAGCAADLGDVRCGVDVSASAWRASGHVLTTDGETTLVVDASGYADGWFTGGAVVFSSGANVGARVEIKAHHATTTGGAISLWAPMPAAITVGDAVVLTAGCDKSFATCRAKFANQVNFRGFPHMPGNDVVMSYPDANAVNMDGGSLFK